ncbi:MAG: T9SS type B sorting domain-containing protein [Polaribacter sp.]|uniref:T9SS type B sorting domain-containing protein n=1 Tax=Polaribacter sp. TaxID=1920175 RepID=UPI003BB0DA9E
MKIYSTLLFLLLTVCISAQREADNWYFGNKAGISFKNPRTDILIDGEMNTPAGCASISDSEGNLLFYTNGETVFNKNHEIMENGDDLATTIENTQTSIIIPKPGSVENFYIFTTKTASSTNPILNEGTYLSEIEITAQHPLGRVLYKYQPIRDSAAEKVTAVHHANGRSIWVIVFGPVSRIANTPLETFTVFEIGNSGIVSTLESKHEETTSKAGAMKVSPDGKYIAVADYGETNIDLYNFNNETGEISLKEKIFTTTSLGSPKSAYGLEFSADSKILYYTADVIPNRFSSINQYLLVNPFPNDQLFNVKSQIFSSSTVYFGSLQLASNGNIYVATYVNGEDSISSSKKLTVIENPESLNPTIRHLSEDLQTGASFKGLPNFIQSYFRNRIITENKCVFDTFNFDIDSYAPITSIIWDFGDGNTSTQRTPNHQYQTPGTYIVKADIRINGNVNAIFKDVRVFALPELKPNVTLEQCDISNDGVDVFDLYDIEDRITNPNLNLELHFYRSLTNAQNDIDRIPNPNNFENQSNPQELFVRAISENGCENVSNFFIRTTFVDLGNIPPMFVCEDSDGILNNGEGLFDLQRKGVDLRLMLNVARTSKLRFYKNQTDALTTSNELPEDFITATTTIYVRVDNDTGCGGIEPINLIVNANLNINLQDTYTICFNPNLKPPVIISGDAINNRFEWRNSNGTIVSIAKDFTLNAIGEFSLTVYKSENGIACSVRKDFVVVNPEIAVFSQIDVNTEDETNNTISLNVIGNSNYEFSLDNTNFSGNGTSFTFTNVEAGLRTVYVRDINNCEEPIQTNVSVIGFKKYFTPNGDGDNDFWNIKGLTAANFKSVNVSIFDRYGKIIGAITNFNSQGWDGSYNGKLLIASNYWFKAEIIDKDDNVIKESGNFSLIRN